MKSLRHLAIFSVLPLIALLQHGGAVQHGEGEQHHASPFEGVDELVAVLQPTEGHEAKGRVVFRQERRDEVHVMAEVSGLEPGSTHAIHVHEFGDLRSKDGASLGGHYNPEGHDHALPKDETRHAGDLGNLEANAEGVARYELTVDNMSLAGPSNPILGRGVVVHEKADDGGQPTGNAGGRIAVGVIGVAKD